MDGGRYLAAQRVLARAAGVLYDRRLTELDGGNMSPRVGDAVVMTPTKASEETGWRLAADDILVIVSASADINRLVERL